MLGLPEFLFLESELAMGHLLCITIISIVVMVRSRNFCGTFPLNFVLSSKSYVSIVELMTRATVQAQLANEAKSRFLATVSHGLPFVSLSIRFDSSQCVQCRDSNAFDHNAGLD